MNDTNLISAETGPKAPPAPGDVRAGLAGYAEWCGSPPVLTDAVELIDQQAQRIAELEAERDKLRARLAEIEAQEPAAHYRASDAEWLAAGRCTTVYKDPAEDWTVPLYARPVAAQERKAPGCGACGDGCARRGSCQLADESPEAAR